MGNVSTMASPIPPSKYSHQNLVWTFKGTENLILTTICVAFFTNYVLFYGNKVLWDFFVTAERIHPEKTLLGIVGLLIKNYIEILTI